MENNKTNNKVSRIKLLSFGNVKTGKSCLIKRYCEKRFVNKYLPTIGVDFGVTKVVYNENKLKMNLFDLSGDPIFAEVRNEFYRDTQAALLVYDVTCKKSFESLDFWLGELRRYITEPSERANLVLLLCANKIDRNDRVVTSESGRDWAYGNGFQYVETSAQTGEGVVNAFNIVFKLLCSLLENGKRPTSAGKEGPVYSKEQLDAIKQISNAKDNYSCLNLSYGASRDEVNRAYKNFAKLLHPDKCSGSHSIEAFKKVAGARDELLKTMQ